MPRFFGYMVIALFLLCGAASAALYYATFAPGGGRIDPRFVVFFKYAKLATLVMSREPSPQEWRADMDRMMGWANWGGSPIFGVNTKDQVIPGKGGAIPLRIYDPKTAPGDKRPLLVFLHGGGFFSGNVKTHDRICRQLAAKAGAVVVSVDYRLAPEFPFPAGFEDSYEALVWAHANAKTLGADPNRLAVAGDSAGGNLAANLALKSRDEHGPKIRYQFLIYPVLNLFDFESETIKLYGDGNYFLDVPGMLRMRGMYLPPGIDGKTPYVSPHFVKDLKGLPPALVITAEFDPLRWEGEAFAERLKAQGVPARARRFLGMGHGFVSISMMSEADEALDDIAATLKASL